MSGMWEIERIITRTDDSKLNRHEDAKKREENFKNRPARSLHEAPSPRGKNKCIPCSHSESADEKILVSAEMRREVERRREDWGGHGVVGEETGDARNGGN